MDKMKTAENKVFRIVHRVLPIVVFVVSLAFTMYTASIYSRNIMDSDSSSELVLANLLSKQNAIISTDWYYSNELRVIHANLVYAPLFKVFSDWHTVRFIGVLILQAILLLSYLFFCRQARISRRAFLYSASILILPYSVQYGRIVLFHTHYLVDIALGFLIVGLYLSVINRWGESAKTKKKIIWMFLLLSVSFLSGLNGIREIANTMVPLFFTAIIVTLKTDRSTGLADTVSFGARWKWILLSLLVCCSGGLGYEVNSNLLAKAYSFRSYGATTTNFITSENANHLFYEFFSQFGYQPGRILFSLEGILACGGIFAALYVAYQGARQLFSAQAEPAHADHPASQASVLVGVYMPVSLLTLLIVFIFINAEPYYYLYFIPVIVLAVPFLAWLMDREQPSKGIKRLALALTCCVMIANGFYNNAYFINPDHKPVIYEGLGKKDIYTVQELQGAVDFLQKNHYNFGYASHWCSNIVTEMTNGEIPMVTVLIDKDNPNITYYNWLSNKTYRDESFVQDKKVFLLLPMEENDAFLATPLADYANQVYQDSLYIVYDFENSDDPWNALND